MKVGPYDVLRKLGEGAYGKVYLARKGDPSGFVTYYALKRIARTRERGAEFEAYLRREAKVGGLVNHPSLVRVHEVITLQGEWVLVQDFVDGVTLGSVLANHRGVGIPRDAALELTASLLESLHYLHTLRDPEGRDYGFVHRDVKPGNVMLTAGHGIRVMDFGVARGDEAGAGTLAGELRGTIAYMAPEQATGGEVGPASDQFAAGLMLLEMLTGGSAWGDIRGAAVLGKVVMGDVSHGLSALPEEHDELQGIALRMLARSPEQRFPSAADAADALRHLRAKTPTPPALRPFCIEAVEALREDGRLEESDEHPSWTGRWAPAGEESAPGQSLGPAGLSLGGRDASASVDEVDDDGRGPSAVVPADTEGSTPGNSEDDIGDELELDDGVASAVSGLAAAIDDSSTLPLQASPAQREAILSALASSASEQPRVGTGETLAELQARFSDMDPEKTLPIPGGAPRASGGLAAPSPEAELRLAGEPARAGVHGPPPAMPTGVSLDGGAKARKRKEQAQGAPRVRFGAQLWKQFLKSPLLGTLMLLGALLLVAATTRIAWMALVPAPDARATSEEEEDLRLPSERLAAKQRGVAPAQPSPASRASQAGEAALEREAAELDAAGDPASEEAPDASTTVGGDESPGDVVALAGGHSGAPAGPAPAEPAPAEPAPAEPAPADPAPALRRSEAPAGEDLDEDLAVWRGESDQPTPAPREPTEGQIISGSGAGDRLLEEADGERRIATRRGDSQGTADASSAEVAAGPRLRFLSSSSQPVGVPLSVRVRSDGFYATSVVVYYQWRSEGAAGRKRRSLRQQPDGSFALEIPASELQTDRLQLWFSAEPGNVSLGDASSPVEVKVR